ncbi:hypothetical protein MMC12_008392 [Toensbergia leucococca]|nr:hypothetical protein [Toensbergia leucococca]
MRYLRFISATLLATLLSFICSYSFAQAPAYENGQAFVINLCEFSVYFSSVGNDSPLPQILLPGNYYKETYRYVPGKTFSPNDPIVLGGVSIKIASNQTIGTIINQTIEPGFNQTNQSALELEKANILRNAFDDTTITQFEYTYNPYIAPGLFYDVSNVNGYNAHGDSDSAETSWPFQMDGLVLNSSSECKNVTCSPGVQICSEAYTWWNDNWATHGCGNNLDIILTLCSTTGALKDSVLEGNFTSTLTSATTFSSIVTLTSITTEYTTL